MPIGSPRRKARHWLCEIEATYRSTSVRSNRMGNGKCAAFSNESIPEWSINLIDTKKQGFSLSIPSM